jgi:mannitol-1-/sugar-/sorbitol-6-/2-deoxyglucose-6-phosphatase
MIKVVIFDMDGILVNSEPFWQESEIVVFETIGLKLTHEMCRETTGLRVDEAVEYWLKRHGRQDYSAGELEEGIVGGVIERIQTQGKPMAGIEHALGFFKSKGVKTALASSSAYKIIWTVLEKFNLREQFDLIYSAEEEPLGKPHPGIYLTVARNLAVKATACLAIEDSLMGVLAAKAARMKCIAVPDPAVRHDPRFAIADCVLGSLLEIDSEVWSRVLDPAH